MAYIELFLKTLVIQIYIEYKLLLIEMLQVIYFKTFSSSFFFFL